MTLFSSKRIITLVFVGIVQLSSSTTVYAKDLELTVMSGYRSSDSLRRESDDDIIKLDTSPGYNLILSVYRDHESVYDILLSRQYSVLRHTIPPTEKLDLRLDHVQLGGTVNYPYDGFNGFTTGGVGITYIVPSDKALSSELRLSMSVGAGVKLQLAEQLGVRLEVRLYGIVTQANGSVFCASNGCVARFSADMFLQYEASAGLYFQF